MAKRCIVLASITRWVCQRNRTISSTRWPGTSGGLKMGRRDYESVRSAIGYEYICHLLKVLVWCAGPKLNAIYRAM